MEDCAVKVRYFVHQRENIVEPDGGKVDNIELGPRNDEAVESVYAACFEFL
jgi:hypothetical protein